MNHAKIYADDRPEGRGPVGVCFRTGKPCIIHDFVDDPRAKPWRERAIAHGLRSAAALPLRLGGEIRGVFSVYAGEKDVFQDKEAGLLQEIADSISFAMDHLEQETIRQQAEESLSRREAQYRAVIETCADGFWMANEEGRILEVNDAYARLSGYRREELVGMHISALEAKEQPAEIAAHSLKIRQNGTDLFESLHRAKDGTIWPVEVNAAYWPSVGGRTMVFLRDITGRKQAEEALVERARLAALGADIGIALTRGDTLREILRSCSEAIVQHLDVAFARIWTPNPQQDVLELQASAGMYTHIDGPHGRSPFRTSEDRPDCPRASAAPDQRRDRRSVCRRPRMGPAGRDGRLRRLSPGRQGSSCRSHGPIRAPIANACHPPGDGLSGRRDRPGHRAETSR